MTMEELKKRVAELEARLAGAEGRDEAAEAEARRVAEETRREEDRLNETVTLRLFRDGRDYKDDLSVTVNNVTCLIRRGEWVQVRRKFADVIEQSQIQDAGTARLVEDRQDEFRAATEALR